MRTFEDNYDNKRTGSTGEHFERALGWVLQSDASTKMPRFVLGTLPMEYKFSPTESVEAVRRNRGDELWFQNFTHNRMHHQRSHVYETIGDEEDDRPSDDSIPPTLNERRLNLSAMKDEPQVIINEKKRPPDMKIDLDPHAEDEVPYELEPMDSSDDYESGGEQENSRPKRRRLQTKRRSAGLSKSRKAGQKEPRRSASPQASKAPKPVAQYSVKDNRRSQSKGTHISGGIPTIL